MKIRELILFEGYKETIQAFAQQAPKEEVDSAIALYKDLVNRNQVQGQERNIDWWRSQGWDKFKEFVDKKSITPSTTQIKRKKTVGRSITLKETDKWLIVIPLDRGASCFHGRNTAWCTANPWQSEFDNYFHNKDVTLIYLINKQDGKKYAIASHRAIEKLELFDQNDRHMSPGQFQTATGFDPHQLVKLIPHDDPRITRVKEQRKQLIQKLQDFMAKLRGGTPKRDAELESLLIDTREPGPSLEYVCAVGQALGPQDFPEPIVLAAVQAGLLRDYDNLGPDAGAFAVNTLLASVANPSKSMILSLVKAHPSAIRHFKNPPLALQIAAVRRDPRAIRNIPNASLALQLEAVRKDGHAIDSILEWNPNPPQEVQIAAMEQNGWAIEWIPNPSEQVQLAAVKQWPPAIERIANPTPAVRALFDRLYDRRKHRMRG